MKYLSSPKIRDEFESELKTICRKKQEINYVKPKQFAQALNNINTGNKFKDVSDKEVMR